MNVDREGSNLTSVSAVDLESDDAWRLIDDATRTATRLVPDDHLVRLALLRLLREHRDTDMQAAHACGLDYIKISDLSGLSRQWVSKTLRTLEGTSVSIEGMLRGRSRSHRSS